MRLRDFIRCVNPDEGFLLDAQEITSDMEIKEKRIGVVTARNMPTKYRDYILYWVGVFDGDERMLRIVVLKDIDEGSDDEHDEC